MRLLPPPPTTETVIIPAPLFHLIALMENKARLHLMTLHGQGGQVRRRRHRP